MDALLQGIEALPSPELNFLSQYRRALIDLCNNGMNHHSSLSNLAFLERLVGPFNCVAGLLAQGQHEKWRDLHSVELTR